MLSITVADSLEVLAARLCDVLDVPPPDPLSADWVAVPPGGVDRWLALRLARALGSSAPDANDGVAANIAFARPGALRRLVLDAGRVGADRVTAAPDPWTLDRMTWGALAVRAEPSSTLPPLPPHLSAAAWAQRVARRFDRYHVYRPEMIRAWARGHDLDGAAHRMRDADRWQPALWRELRVLAGEPSPPEVLPGLLDALARWRPGGRAPRASGHVRVRRAARRGVVPRAPRCRGEPTGRAPVRARPGATRDVGLGGRHARGGAPDAPRPRRSGVARRAAPAVPLVGHARA